MLGIKYSIFYTDNTQANIAFVIAYVLKGSPAEKAGLKEGDMLITEGYDLVNDGEKSILKFKRE